MSIRLSTAGVKVGYVVEETAGTKPTTGVIEIPEIKEIPEMNPEPSTLDTTTLKETEYKTSIPGLKDLGGALGFLANLTEDFKNAWEEMVTAYETAKTAGKNTWFVIQHPSLTEAVMFTGAPSALGLPGMSVDAVLEATVYVTPTNAPTWVEAPTWQEK